MTIPVHGITTLLSEMTPELEHQLRSIPGRDAALPGNAYPAAELYGHKVSIHRRCSTVKDLIPLHSHSFFEYIFCRQVPDMEYLVGNHRYRIRTGDMIYIPPGTPHRPLFPDGCTECFMRDELWISPELTDLFGNRLPPDYLANRKTPYLFRVDTHWQTEIDLLFQKGAEENEKQYFRWDSAVEGYAWLLMVATSRALLDERTQLVQQESPNLFDRIITYLESDLSKKITLEETANLFYVSKSTINRTFQKHTGTSFYRCLTQRRMLAARHLILEGLPLEDVSVQVGFSDYATFYRAFRQEFDVSPRQFRNIQRSDG